MSDSDQDFQDAENPLDENLFLDEDDDIESHEAAAGAAAGSAGTEAAADPTYGFHIVASMKESELDELIQLLEGQCSLLDTVSVNIRTRKIDWSKIFVGDYGPNECKAAWEFLRSNTRKFRNMAEVIQEIKLSCEKDKEKFRTRLIHGSPGFPKKPASGAIQMFCRFMWENNPEKRNFVRFSKKCADVFENLPAHDKSDWQYKAEVAKAEYERKVKEYFAQYPGFAAKLNKKHGGDFFGYNNKQDKSRISKKPGWRSLNTAEFQAKFPDAPEVPTTPRLEFIQSRLNDLDPPPTPEDLPAYKQQFLDEWEKLSDKKRYKWIKKCLKHCGEYLDALVEYENEHPDFVPLRPFKITNHLSKTEIDLWLKKNDWPVPPARNVFEQYVQDYIERQGGSTDDKDIDELRAQAEQEYKTISSTDQQLCRIDFRRRFLEYKKSIETHFAGTPEFLKPFIYSKIPKKCREGLTLTVPKFSDEAVIEVEEAEPMDEPDLDDEPLAKRKKKNHPQTHAHIDVDHDDIKILPIPHKSPSKPGPGTSAAKALIKPLPAKPTPNQFQPQRAVSQKDMYDIIRGIFDGRAHLGRGYSAFYYYAKYVAAEKVWIKSVQSIAGLVGTAKKIFLVFCKLEEKQKQVFIDQSYQFYKDTGAGLKKLMKEDRLDYGRLYGLQYFPGEPIEPTRNARTLYYSEMRGLKRRYKGHLVPPAWDELDTNVQQAYMRKYYQKVEEYVKKYEEFVNKMTPNDLLIYTSYRNAVLEKYNLSRPTQISNTGYGHPYSRGYYNEDNNIEAEDSEPELFKSALSIRKNAKETTNVLRNEKTIDKLVNVRTVRPRKQLNADDQEQLLTEIQTEPSSSDDADSSEDESNIVWKNMRDYKDQFDQLQVKKYVKSLSKYYYDINGIPDLVQIQNKDKYNKNPHGFTLSKILENAVKLDKIGNVARRHPKKRVPKGIL